MLGNSQLIDRFEEYLLTERGLARTTCASYRIDLLSLTDYLAARQCTLLAVDAATMADYLTSLQMKSSSLARRVSTYRQFYKFLLHERLIATTPMTAVRMPKAQHLSPNALSLQDTEALFATAYADNSAAGLRTAVILELLYSTGLRISELLSLRVDDMLECGSIKDEVTVKGKGDKERLAVVNPRARAVLERYLQAHHKGWLFPGKRGSHLSRQQAFNLLKAVAVKAGLDPALFSPHVMRHSFATHMIRNGLDIRIAQELLGHASISSTQIYTKLSMNEVRTLVEEHHPLSAKVSSH
jgi:integrase/recombinase XerD